MSEHSHAVVWIDHREARVLQFNAAEDHPTDGELVAHARRYFRAADRMTPQQS
jgi:hypothetical protein